MALLARREARQLRASIHQLTRSPAPAPARTAPAPDPGRPATPAQPAVPVPAPATAAPTLAAPVSPSPAGPPPMPKPARPPARDWEQVLTQRWGTLVGAAALLLAGVFLVRTAAEKEWLGPGAAMRHRGVLGALRPAGRSGCGAAPSGAGGVADYAPAALAAGGWRCGWPAPTLPGRCMGWCRRHRIRVDGRGGLAGLALSLRFGPLVGGGGPGRGVRHAAAGGHDSPSLPGLFGYLLLVSRGGVGGGALHGLDVAGLGRRGARAACGMLAGSCGHRGGCLGARPVRAGGGGAAACCCCPAPRWSIRSGAVWPGRRCSLLGAAGLCWRADRGPAARTGVLLLAPVTVAKAWAEPRLARLPLACARGCSCAAPAWALPAWQATGEAITSEGTVQAVLPGAWAPEALLPLLQTAAGMAALVRRRRAGAGAPAPRPLPWAALAAAVPVLTLALTYLQTGVPIPGRLGRGGPGASGRADGAAAMAPGVKDRWHGPASMPRARWRRWRWDAPSSYRAMADAGHGPVLPSLAVIEGRPACRSAASRWPWPGGARTAAGAEPCGAGLRRRRLPVLNSLLLVYGVAGSGFGPGPPGSAQPGR